MNSQRSDDVPPPTDCLGQELLFCPCCGAMRPDRPDAQSSRIGNGPTQSAAAKSSHPAHGDNMRPVPSGSSGGSRMDGAA